MCFTSSRLLMLTYFTSMRRDEVWGIRCRSGPLHSLVVSVHIVLTAGCPWHWFKRYNVCPQYCASEIQDRPIDAPVIATDSRLLIAALQLAFPPSLHDFDFAENQGNYDHGWRSRAPSTHSSRLLHILRPLPPENSAMLYGLSPPPAHCRRLAGPIPETTSIPH
ncbi:hypothetical protein BDN71DRAFT_652116 [Pleurotus eryngii]|uniref:Uncharacterized protein n=1 Tax=Pleurotus eryngii TaxID=5323 RepID=A0A9P6D968_PLEER|nr:hypothetical protein BDN71DRAFT_652116 [Pleurotus eryngii]